MQIHLNGQALVLDVIPDNLLHLLDNHHLTQGRFAVEVDGLLIPKSRLTNIALVDGMKIEVVQAVGGG